MPLPESTWLRVTTQLDCLSTLLAGAESTALERKPSPDKWSARENLAHLARYQHVFMERLERIRTERDPQIPRYLAEHDPQWKSWAPRPSSELLEDLRTQRSELVRHIREWTDSDLAKTGIHSRLGRLTAIEWLEFFLLHEAHHLLAIFQRARESNSVT